MKKRATLLVWILMVIFAMTLSVSAQAQEKKIVAKLADILSPDHPHTRSWVYFAEKVKEKTKGRVEVQVYHSGQLGQTKDLYLGMQMGNVEMAKVSVSFTGEWIPELYVFDLPYLFNNRDEMWRVFKSRVGNKSELGYSIPFIPVGIRYGGRSGWRRRVEVCIGSPLFAEKDSDAVPLTHRAIEEISRLCRLPLSQSSEF